MSLTPACSTMVPFHNVGWLIRRSRLVDDDCPIEPTVLRELQRRFSRRWPVNVVDDDHRAVGIQRLGGHQAAVLVFVAMRAVVEVRPDWMIETRGEEVLVVWL